MGKMDLLGSPDTCILTHEEETALAAHEASGKPSLAISVSNNFYNLWAQGRSCLDIQSLNPHYSLGQIVQARKRDGWDTRKSTNILRLVDSLPRRIQEVRAIAIHHLLDKIVIANMEFSKQMEIYMQNPVPENLPANRITDSKELSEVVKTIGELADLGTQSQEQTQQMQSGGTSVTVVVNEKQPGPSGTIVDVESSPVKAAEEIVQKNHKEILSAILAEKNKNG